MINVSYNQYNEGRRYLNEMQELVDFIKSDAKTLLESIYHLRHKNTLAAIEENFALRAEQHLNNIQNLSLEINQDLMTTKQFLMSAYKKRSLNSIPSNNNSTT